MEELDAELAAQPPKPKQDRSQNKTLDQVLKELDLENGASESLQPTQAEDTD